MDEQNNNQSYDLDSIIAEFRSPPAGEPKPPPESLADRSKRLVMKTMDDAFGADGFELLGGIIDETAREEAPAAAEPPEAALPEPGAELPPPVLELDVRALVDADELAEYAAAESVAEPPPGEDAPEPPRRAERKDAKARPVSPLVALLALIALRRENRARGEGRQPAVEEAETPELPPEKAVRFYGAQMRSLRLRGLLAAGVCLVMLYLSFAWYSAALPLTGALNGNIRVLSLLLLILEITAVMCGLDLFTGGLLGVARRRMGAESLVAVSCLLSMLDAAVTAAVNTTDYGLPFCAVSAISLTFAVWGAYYACKGRRTGFRVLASSRTLYTVTAERGVTPEDVALLKSRRGAAGFVRRSEEADAGEYVYEALTPFLLLAALVLGLLAGVARRQAGATLHILSALVAASATFSCAICFSVPFAVAARRLRQSGAAIAGWSGLRDIGGSRHVVITDGDVFPRGTVEIGKIRILEGAFTDKVISYTGSVIAASGSGLAGPFADLIRRNGYTISKVEDFEPHDGGGMTAIVGGESVCVGGTGFMNLMGIRLPRRLSTKTSVYTAINGALVGIFSIEYRPVSSVQDALVLLLHSRLEPVFAIRDFNITPAMLKKAFKMPTDGFKFPSYSERYRISGAEPDRDSRVAAVLVREGMGPLVDAAERGRRAHFGVKAAGAVSAAGSVFGLIILFLLCWTGAFDSATVSNVITFMLLWLLPVAIVILGLER